MTKNISELKILVVEGNRHMRDLVVKLLRALGISQICLAFDQTVAFQNLNLNSFDGILTDQHGETVDGFEFARQIRAYEKDTIRNVPIIMMVQNDEEAVAAAAREAGATHVVVKPFSADQFYAAVHGLCKQNGRPTKAEVSAWIGGR